MKNKQHIIDIPVGMCRPVEWNDCASSFAKKIMKIAAFCGCSVLMLFSACDGDIDFGEQYKKTIYLVHGNNLLYTKEHLYGAENDRLIFSVYCASSESIKQDVSVLLKIDQYALDSLNTQRLLENSAYIDKQMLPAASYEMPAEAQVIIPAGKQYALLEIPFHPENLDPDVSYALPISIVSNNCNYGLSYEARSLVYEIKMTNKYSGIFTGASAETPTVVRPVQITLKAISENQVRMPIHDLNADEQYLNTNFMLLTVDEDGLVTIAPWANAQIVDLGGSFCDEVQQSFELHYLYIAENGDMFTITEKIANINAPKLVQ